MTMAAFSNEAGDFVFSLQNNTAISGIEEVSGTGFKQSPVINGKPRQELAGGELDRVQIKAVCYGPTSKQALAPLDILKASRLPIVFVEGNDNRGRWTIKQVRKTKDEIMKDGVTRRIKFTVQLEEFANE